MKRIFLNFQVLSTFRIYKNRKLNINLTFLSNVFIQSDLLYGVKKILEY